MAMKDSPRELMTFSIEVEPSVETVPERVVSVLLPSVLVSALLSFLLPQAVSRLSAMTAVSARVRNFFI